MIINSIIAILVPKWKTYSKTKVSVTVSLLQSISKSGVRVSSGKKTQSIVNPCLAEFFFLLEERVKNTSTRLKSKQGAQLKNTNMKAEAYKSYADMVKIGANYVSIQGIDASLMFILVTVSTWKYNKDNSNKTNVPL